MKKSTWILLGAAAVIALVTWLVTKKGDAPEAKTLAIAGYATPAQLEEDKQRKLLEGPLDIAHPIDEIRIERKDLTVTLKRTGEGKDAQWSLTEPMRAQAVKYVVEKIPQLFKTETNSVYSRSLKAGDEALYDLEPERRVHVTLKAGGSVWNGVDLVVGKVDKGESPDEPGAEPSADTWVMRADDPGTIYRIAGKDLRTPLMEGLSTLRDKKVFAFAYEDLDRVEVTAPDGASVALAATRTEPPAPDAEEAPDDGAEAPKPKPKPELSWALEAPPGFTADSQASSLPRSLANLRVTDFVPLAEVPEGALTGSVWRVTAKVHDQEAPVTVVLADGVSDGDVVWGRVEGQDEGLKLQKYAADNLRKTVADLRLKAVVSTSQEAITGLTLVGDAGPIVLAKGADGWRFEAPALPYKADPTSILGTVAKLQAARWARPDELEAAGAAVATPDIVGRVATATEAWPLRFSAPIADGPEKDKRWGVVADGAGVASAEPFLVQDYVAKRLVTTVGDLRDKAIFPQAKDAIARVAVTLAGETAPTAVLERPEPGKEPTLVDVPEGKKAQEAPVRTIISTLGVLKAKSFPSGISLADAGLTGTNVTKLAVSYDDGATVTLTLSEKAVDSDVYATADAGPLAGQVFTVNGYQAKNLQKKRDELVQ